MTASLTGTSTNDMTSTANQSMNSVPSMAITTEAIMRECVRLGLYRNPVCNDKLYLHGKGFDSIDSAAFDPYTDVKVLWLEGNAISALACGAQFVQTRPPKRRDPFASASESSSDDDDSDQTKNDTEENEEQKDKEDEDDEEEKRAPAKHVDPMLPLSTTAQPTVSRAKKLHKRAEKRSSTLPTIASVASESKDIFSSLYPTLRHLYLHNNVFRSMPDLHRFERLDTVNLANNFFSTIEPGCPEWNQARAAFLTQRDERHQLAENVSKSAARERQEQARVEEEEGVSQHAAHDDDVTRTGAGEETAVVVVDAAVAAERRRHELDGYRRYADAATQFCPHVSIAFEAGGGDPRVIEPHCLHTCSSVRTLNLAGNHIEDFDDYVGLLCYKALSSLDLSQNRIKDGELLLLVLERMPCLLALKLSGNPCVRTLSRYRKRVLAACTQLMTLDDRPVFEEERRLVTAWAEGGEPAEARERQRMKEEKEAAQQKRIDDFRALLAQHRGQDGSAGGAYVNAVSTPHALHRASGGVGGGGGEADDDSVTSSETESSGDDEAAVIAPVVGENSVGVHGVGESSSVRAGHFARGDQRVLTSNRSTSGTAAAAVPKPNEEPEDDMEDVYVP